METPVPVVSRYIGDYRYDLYSDSTAQAQVTDFAKSSYGALQESVWNRGSTYALTSLHNCFHGCTSLTTAPEIPPGVTDISGCFQGCTSLTGVIAVHGAPRDYGDCFADTTQPIALLVTDATELPTWQQVAATGNNGNVSVTMIDPSTNPAPTATITAVRVASRGSTTPDEIGRYAYVTVRTAVSTKQVPDNVAQAPIITLDGSACTPLDPSGTATHTCWVALGDDYGHVIGAAPRDLYKTGTTVTVTLPSTYSPMEFHRTGDGASFGKHATRAGVLDVAWDIESDGDVSDATGTLDQVRQDGKNAGNITSGTLPVARGGTGVATAAAERNRLGLGNTTGALPVANGGTGATTASAAVQALTGRAWDYNTNNTTDTWVPVSTTVNGVGTWQHRVIPKIYYGQSTTKTSYGGDVTIISASDATNKYKATRGHAAFLVMNADTGVNGYDLTLTAWQASDNSLGVRSNKTSTTIKVGWILFVY